MGDPALTSEGSPTRHFDVAIVGAGVLGVTIANWLSQRYDCSVALLDLAPEPAYHTSGRNTGVIHRPFYLNPDSKKVFAQSALLSFPLWRMLAMKCLLPWKETGTLEVAQSDEDMRTVEKYMRWGARNGIPDGELEILDSTSVKALEGEVECEGAILSKNDISVDFGSFTKAVFSQAERNGAVFLPGSEVNSVSSTRDGVNHVTFKNRGFVKSLEARYLINAAGGGSVDIAHMMGVGAEYTDLHFRGDYWMVDDPFASTVTRNIYSIAGHSQFPFLDPHFVVRANGSRQIGPNAALVGGPFAYRGPGKDFVGKLLESPIAPKVHLFSDTTFLSLVWSEWRSSLSKSAMCARVRRFIPRIRPSMLSRRGLSGVRSSLINKEGFVPEAVQLETSSSAHILNFNSPGATGAPSYSAFVVEKLRESGALDFLRLRRSAANALWNYDEALGHGALIGE
jgi:L-2-hydroxyglutarate oxidase